MLYIEKIKMKPGCFTSNDLTEIDQVYIPEYGFQKKSNSI